MKQPNDLEQTLHQHTLWARTNGASGKRANLSGADLRMCELPSVNLSHAILRGTNFERANLSGARLDGADLQESNLSYAHLANARLSNADLTGVRAYGAFLEKANLAGTVLNRAVFDDSLAPGAILDNARARKASFNRCDLSLASLDGVKFEDVRLAGANLSNASLKAAELWGGTLQGASVVDIALAETLVEDVALDASATALAVPEELVELSAQQSRRAIRLQAKGKSVGEIARTLGVSRTVVRNNLLRLAHEAEETATQRGNTADVRNLQQLAKNFKLGATVAIVLALCASVVLVLLSLLDLLEGMFPGTAPTWRTERVALWMGIAVVAVVASGVWYWISQKLLLSANERGREAGGLARLATRREQQQWRAYSGERALEDLGGLDDEHDREERA